MTLQFFSGFSAGWRCDTCHVIGQFRVYWVRDFRFAEVRRRLITRQCCNCGSFQSDRLINENLEWWKSKCNDDTDRQWNSETEISHQTSTSSTTHE